jgi:hypothetical protein
MHHSHQKLKLPSFHIPSSTIRPRPRQELITHCVAYNYKIGEENGKEEEGRGDVIYTIDFSQDG